MSRPARLVALAVYAVAFFLVAGVAASVVGALGPTELALTMAVAAPVALMLTRPVRGALGRRVDAP